MIVVCYILLKFYSRTGRDYFCLRGVNQSFAKIILPVKIVLFFTRKNTTQK